MDTHTPRISIAMDGYSSAGKSTMAKQLAKRLGYCYIDTGAMYRAVTLYAQRQGIQDRPDALIAALADINVSFTILPDGQQHTLLNGEDVEKEIRTLAVSDKVSAVASIPEVRHALVKQQQAMAATGGIVMDGRDIGTTVLPDADLKIFVTASAETRAQRRFKELREKGDDNVTYRQVYDNIRQRDYQDTTRKESPLRQATDALVLDNSHMSVEEQNAWLDNAVSTVLASMK